MKNYRLIIAIQIFLFLAISNGKAQLIPDWNYIDTNETITAPMRAHWIDSGGNVNYIYWDKETYYNLNKINNEGNNIYNKIFLFPDTLDLGGQFGFAADNEDNIYSWGIALLPPVSTTSVLIKFTPDFSIDWVYYFPDSVSVNDAESVFFSNEGNIICVTRAEHGHGIWEFSPAGDILTYFYYPASFNNPTFQFGGIYDNRIYLFNPGSDTLYLWISDIDEGFIAEKRITGIGSYPEISISKFVNSGLISSSGFLYLWLTRFNDEGLLTKYLLKINSGGDTVWTHAVALPSDAYWLRFDDIYLNEEQDKIITVGDLGTEDDSVFLVVNNFDSSGYLLTAKYLPLQQYFNTSEWLSAIFNPSANNIYIHLPDLGEEFSGLITTDAAGYVERTDTLNVAFADPFGYSYLLQKEENKLVIIDEKANPYPYRSIEVTQLTAPTDAVEQIQQDQMKIFPNPFYDRILISADKNVNALLTIFDVYGRIVLSTYIHAGQNTVSTLSLVSGIYFYTCTGSNKENQTGKLIKP